MLRLHTFWSHWSFGQLDVRSQGLRFITDNNDFTINIFTYHESSNQEKHIIIKKPAQKLKLPSPTNEAINRTSVFV